MSPLPRPTACSRCGCPSGLPNRAQPKRPKTRTWHDRGGKFTVTARLLRVTDANVVLLREDGKEITVPLEKLSDADQKYAEDAKASQADSPGKEDPSPAAAGSADADDLAAGQRPVPLTPTSLKKAAEIKIAADTPWSYQPHAAPQQRWKLTRIPLAPTLDVFEKPERILFLASAQEGRDRFSTFAARGFFDYLPIASGGFAAQETRGLDRDRRRSFRARTFAGRSAVARAARVWGSASRPSYGSTVATDRAPRPRRRGGRIRIDRSLRIPLTSPRFPTMPM